MNRRQFFKTTSAAAFGLAAFPAFTADFADAKKRVGLIGCGWYGKAVLGRLLQIAPVEVVSLCDVDQRMLADCAQRMAARQVSKKTPRTYGDYREMLKEKNLDVVIVSTPDHWHALAMIAAVQAGADVYCEKPISVDVVEGQAMLVAARKYGRVVQINTQRRSTPHLVEARNDIIKAGKLGKVGLVELYSYYHARPLENPPDSAPPDYLDYEMWTGPAPLRPYNRQLHPRGWRGFMEYGNGVVGDLCVHMFDMARWMLDLGWPLRISSTGGIYLNKEARSNIADTQTATFDFGDLQLVWTHRTYGDAPDPKYPWAATFYGDRGTLKAGVMGYDFTPTGGGSSVHRDVAYELDKYPEDRTEKDLEKHTAPAVRAHLKDFLAAVATRGKPVADIEQGYISTTACILANLSMQLGRTLKWDAAQGLVVGDAEANRLLRRPYRAPWIRPEPETV